ncbi:hypothetical protein ES703_51170 [subsurface metagenome]
MVEKKIYADVEGGGKAVIGTVDSLTGRIKYLYIDNRGKPGQVAELNHDDKLPSQNLPPTVASRGDVEGTRVSLTSAALRLLSTQNKDGGWEWMNPDTNPNHGIPSPYNTLGVTGQGILDCYRIGAQNRCLKACKEVYDAMVTNSEDANPSKHRIRGPDIGFLVELSEATGDATYANFAKARWASAKAEFGGGTATGFAEYIRDVRKGQNLPAVISWDINLYIQSLLALDRYFPGEGFAGEAKAMVEVVYNSLYVPPVDFDITDDTLNEFWIGISGALDAFVTTNTHTTESAALATQLEGGQEDDGHWPGVDDGSDVQTTAYVVLALIHAESDRPVVAGVNYLVSSQQANGGWLYDGGENTEVTSESIQAIYHFAF